MINTNIDIDFLKTIAIFVVTFFDKFILYGIIVPFILYFLYIFFKKNGTIKMGKKYSWNSGSDANPPSKMYKNGFLWTPLKNLKYFSNRNKKKRLHINMNEFRYFNHFIKISKMPGFIRKRKEKTKIYIDAHNAARGILAVGSAGSGKTEWILNIIKQNFYKKAIIYSKKGDFEPYFAREKDIILSPKLLYGQVHDILSEDIRYIMTYLTTLMNGTLGKSQDYFSGSAKQKLEIFCKKIKVEEKDTSLEKYQKWQKFIEYYETAVMDANNGDQKSEKDVMSTVRAVMQDLYLIAYRISKGHKCFTVKDFFESNEDTKLFLSATDTSTEGLLAASTAVLLQYQLQMPDTKTYDEDFLVAWFLDEFLSLSSIIDDKLMAEMSRVGRSKGICPFKLLQSFPTEKEELKELISNYQYLLIFSVIEPETLRIIVDIFGQIEYEKYNESKNGKNITLSKEMVKDNVVNSSMIQNLQNEGFSHILFAPKENLLYKGYSPQSNLKVGTKINMSQEIDMIEFYEWQLKKEEDLKQGIQNHTLNNSFDIDLDNILK